MFVNVWKRLSIRLSSLSQPRTVVEIDTEEDYRLKRLVKNLSNSVVKSYTVSVILVLSQEDTQIHPEISVSDRQNGVRQRTVWRLEKVMNLSCHLRFPLI